MKSTRGRKIVGALLMVIALTAVCYNAINFGFPTEISIIEGHSHEIKSGFPLKLGLYGNDELPLTINGFSLNERLDVNLKDPLVFRSSRMGTYNFECKWLNIIPIKKVTVHVLPETKVIPGGHSLGVKLRPDGVIVVGFAEILDEKGSKASPAKDIGMEIGDTICMVNQHKISGTEDLSRYLDSHGENPLVISIKRNGTLMHFKAKSVKTNHGQYQLGLWVKDVAAGVGTLSFYDPQTGFYGALGHIVSDADTGRAIEVGQGEIIRSRITSILPGKRNKPGEKRGVFVNEDRVIGNILANTPLGIFGQSIEPFENPKYEQLFVATVNQVREGSASILTVLNGESIQEFNIEIQRILKRATSDDGKGMIIKITDDELISKTGGIVQGMSGSPILQNGYLVGVVTHVFVNDPTKGYGVFAEWMFDEIKKIRSNEFDSKNI